MITTAVRMVEAMMAAFLIVTDFRCLTDCELYSEPGIYGGDCTVCTREGGRAWSRSFKISGCARSAEFDVME